MRSILALIVLSTALLSAQNCLAASDTTAPKSKLELDYHPIPAGPISDYSAERIKYIQRVAFMFRTIIETNPDFRIPGSVVKNPETTVRLHFTAEGKLEKFDIERGSGDSSFDMAVGFALQKSIQILPPPLPQGNGKPFSILVRVCAAC